jgi:transcriptional regulator with XRE-family HTH domain
MADEKKQVIGAVLKAARIKRKKTADEVGQDCNVSRSRVYQWEASDYVFPKNLKALSAALQVSIRRLKAVNGSRAKI